MNDDAKNNHTNTTNESASATQKYVNSLLKMQMKPEFNNKGNESIGNVSPTCHSILQRRSLPERAQPLVQVGENKYKHPPPPPPMSVKNRLGSTTEIQNDDKIFRSKAEEIARELQIVRNITNLPPLPPEPVSSHVPYVETQRFAYDYDEDDQDDMPNEAYHYEDGSPEPYDDPGNDPAYNIGENFKIARPILSRTTSVGRLVNNFENLEETRSLAGDVRKISPPLTNSQRRFGTLTRQRTHLGLGSEYDAMTNNYDENNYSHSPDNMEDRNGMNNECYDGDDENVGWGATRHRTGPTTGKFRGVTNIRSAKNFVPPSQPKPPLPPPPSCFASRSTPNYLHHSVRFSFYFYEIIIKLKTNRCLGNKKVQL